MASIVVTGDTSGAITIAAPAVAGTNTLTLPASTGTLVVTGGAQTIEFADGSAAAPSITNSGDTNTGMFFPAADTIAASTAGAERMRIDSNGNALFNSAASGSAISGSATVLAIKDGATANLASFKAIGGNNDTQIELYGGSSTTGIWTSTNTPMVFATNGTERMRITSGGDLCVGDTATGGTDTRLTLKKAGGTTWSVGPNTGASGNTFYVLNSSSQGVYLSSGSTSWTANSDERTKDIIEPITNAANKVASLRAVIGKYKTDEESVRRTFLIAQDVQAVLPEAVDVQNDEQSTLGLRYTDVIPLLVASIKELNAKVEAQAVRIAELEGAK